jgi:hypothetical protein
MYPRPETRLLKTIGILTALLAFLLVAASCVERQPANEAQTETTSTPEPTATATPTGVGEADEQGQGRRHCPAGPGAHADYTVEPTFATPEEAVQDANESHPEIDAPSDLTEYIVIERADWWIDFEYVVDDELQHRWEIIRAEDGTWGMAALDYCGPGFPFR